MNDKQKEQLKQNLINLMESVGNETFQPAPLSRTFLAASMEPHSNERTRHN